MCKCSSNTTVSAPLFNKLELKCDKRQITPIQPVKTAISNKEKSSRTAQQKLQLKKHFSFDLSNRLIDQANDLIEFNALADESEKANQDLIIPTYDLKNHRKSFDTMRTCSNRIEVENGKITKVFRCKHKLCSICNGIKQCKLIERYTPFFELHKEDVYLVTLTFKNVCANRLNKACHDQRAMFSCIRTSMNRNLKRSGLSNLEGVLKLETTVNFIEGTYHPHLHILIVGKDNAEAIPDAWIKKASQYGYETDARAQDVRKCTNLKEIFKYVTKISYATDKDDLLQKVPLKHLINIYHSLSATSTQKKVRTISHFGVTVKELVANQEYSEKIAPVVDQEPDDEGAAAPVDTKGEASTDVFDWNLRVNDFYSQKTGLRYGGLMLNDWKDSRYVHKEHSELFSQDTKNLISGKDDRMRAVLDVKIDNVFRTEKIEKYYDDFRTYKQQKEHPYDHNLISYNLPKQQKDEQ